MPSWWQNISTKNGNQKTKRGSFLDALNRRLHFSSARRRANQSEGTGRRHNDSISKRGFQSSVPSVSPTLSAAVSRSQSFAHPLPLPSAHSPTIGRADSGILRPAEPEYDLDSKQRLFSSPPGADCLGNADAEGDIATASISSDSSAAESVKPTIVYHKVLYKHVQLASPKQLPVCADLQILQVSQQGVLSSAPESTMLSPRNPEPPLALGPGLLTSNTCPDKALLGSGQCSSPGSGSGHNSIVGDSSGQLLWAQNRCSPEWSPGPSSRMTSPGPSSRITSPGPSSRIPSTAVTPLHPRAGGQSSESAMIRPEDSRQRSHRLPLPPILIPNTSSFSPNYSRATSPTVPRSPAIVEIPASPGSRWKKGRLLGRGSFGHVYLGFDRQSGEMCAMKEVTLYPEDPKSKESAQQLNQEIAMLSRLRHPNIVRYYGSETIGDKLYIYLEYVSGGSIYKLLQEYGKFGENAIRSYTQQILSGLVYLHSKNTIHRDIKGGNILVDPNGRVKLADFGMAKHITGQYCPLSFKGSPYWMAPEVIKNSNGYNLSVDIWSLGCTVLEMATAKPPWSRYEGVAAMFKIGNSKELPEIPDHLSDDGKDFVRRCLRRNPSARPSAAQLLEHPFVKNGAPLEKHVIAAGNLAVTVAVNNIMRTPGILNARKLPGSDSEDTPNHRPKGVKIASETSTTLTPRNMSIPVSPIDSPMLRSRSPQHMRGMLSPPAISSPHARSGATMPLTGGNGGVALHLKHQEPGIGTVPMLPSSFCSGNLSKDHNDPDLSRRWSQPSLVFQDTISSGQGKPTNSNTRQSCLEDHVSQQLLSEELSFTQYLDQEPKCSTPARADRT